MFSGRRRWLLLVIGGPGLAGRRRRAALGFDEVADEGLFKGFGAALLDQSGGHVAVEHLARMHHRHAVAAFGLVHEVGGNEDRHPVAPRQLDEQPPECIARYWIDPGGRLVQNQQFGLVHHGDCQRQALAYAQRQAGRQAVDDFHQAEALHHLFDAARNVLRGHAEQLGVQLQVLAYRDFAVERERLGHVADAAAGAQIMRVHFMAEQPGPTLARRQQAGKHLHRRGLAAPVGAEEAEDFTAPDAEGHAVDGNEVAKAHGQPLGFDGDIVRAVLRQRRNDNRLVSALFLFREQADECLFQVRAACSCQQFLRRTGGEDLAVVDGGQPVEALCLIHVGGGHDHAHAGAVGADAFDQIPELCARQRVHASRRLIENQKIRVMNQRAAQAEFLLHAPGQLACRALQEFEQASGLGELIDPLAALCGAMTEQAREELQILLDRERRIQVFAQSLRHVGDARAHFLAMGLAGHVATQHLDRALLDDAHTRQQ